MGKTILIVDDDPAGLLSYGRLLGRLGHTVILEDDCERIRRNPRCLDGVDLLILDYRMPCWNGLDLLEALRREAPEAAAHPAVLLISAFLTDELRARATGLGVVGIIDKPVDPRNLLSRVSAALGDDLRALAGRRHP